MIAILLALIVTASAETYVKVATVNLSVAGSTGGHGDWVAYDCDTETVWLSHSPDQNVVVLDTESLDIRVIIPNVLNANGIAFNRFFAFVADNQNNTVNIYNKYTYQLVQKLSTPGGPDGVSWDSNHDALWVTLDTTSHVLKFSTHGILFNPVPVVNISLNTTASPSAGPDVGIYVPELRRFYQPIDNFINVIDGRRGVLLQVWSLPFHGSIKGLSYDPVTRHLFFGTSANTSYIISAIDGTVVSNITLPGAVDQSVVNANVRHGYLGDKAGYVDVVDLDRGVLLQSIPSATAAHTLTAVSNNAKTTIFSYFDQLNEVGVFVWTH